MMGPSAAVAAVLEVLAVLRRPRAREEPAASMGGVSSVQTAAAGVGSRRGEWVKLACKQDWRTRNVVGWPQQNSCLHVLVSVFGAEQNTNALKLVLESVLGYLEHS